MRIQYLSGSDNVSRSEFKLNNRNLENQITVVKSDVSENKEALIKISHILLGNGDVGLLEKVNLLFLRNQFVDKAVTVLVGIGSSLVTLYLTGVLQL